GGANDAVRLLEVVDDAGQGLAVRGEIVDRLAVLLLRTALPVVALVERIGEVEAAAGAQPDVVRAVEQLSVVILDHDGSFARGTDAPQLVLLVRARPEVPPRVEAEAVRATAGLPE